MAADWDRALNEDVPRLAALLHETDVDEIEITIGDKTVRVRRQVASPDAVAPPADPDAAAPSETGPAALVTIGAEAVGVFYRAREGEETSLVAEGATVEERQVLAFIDVLGVPHEVLAPAAGTVARFLVNDGEPVAYGQPLVEFRQAT